MQKAYELYLSNLTNQNFRLEELNSLLSTGYEVEDIVPIYDTSGGAIYTNAYGVYTTKVIIFLKESSQKAEIKYIILPFKGQYMEKLQAIINRENANGINILKVIPMNGFIDPQSGYDLGRGSFGLCLFFVKHI